MIEQPTQLGHIILIGHDYGFQINKIFPVLHHLMARDHLLPAFNCSWEAFILSCGILKYHWLDGTHFKWMDNARRSGQTILIFFTHRHRGVPFPMSTSLVVAKCDLIVDQIEDRLLTIKSRYGTKDPVGIPIV